MESKDRIIVALDVDNVGKAIDLVEELMPYVGCFKIGLEFVHTTLKEIIGFDEKIAIQQLRNIRRLFQLMDGKVFWDGKFNDFPNTIGAAGRSVMQLGVKMFNVHCLGGKEMMQAAKQAANATLILGHPPLVLGVTVLTSLDHGNLVELGIMEKLNIANAKEREETERNLLERLIVGRLACLAKECGLDGVIASPKEIEAIRKYCGPDFLIVTPDIHPAWAAARDQGHVMRPMDAIEAGADYLVIGRPITRPPADVGSPAKAAQVIAEEISTGVFERMARENEAHNCSRSVP